MSGYRLHPRSPYVITPFYDEFLSPGVPHPYYCLSNFSKHPIQDPKSGITYPTSEHYFQAQKVMSNPRYSSAERKHFINGLLNNPSPRSALEFANLWTGKNGKTVPGVRPWDKADVDLWEKNKIKVMSDALSLKMDQHADVRAALMETGDTCLVEDTDTDEEWGWGSRGVGKNLLGKLWMHKRNNLHLKQANNSHPLVKNPNQLYQQVQKERIALGPKSERLERYGVAHPSVNKMPASPAVNTPASNSPFGNLFSGLSSLFGGNFGDGLKKAGQGIFNLFKDFANGSLKIEPLDLNTAIADLIKCFFNAIFECVVKPAANAMGITDQNQKTPSKASDPATLPTALGKPSDFARGDKKSSVEKATMAKDSSKGIGFSSGSRDAGLGAHPSARKGKTMPAFGLDDNHDELYDFDSIPSERAKDSRRHF